MGFKVSNIEKGTFKNGIMVGDEIISVNGEEMLDYVDYTFFSSLSSLDIKVKRGENFKTVHIEKEDYEPLGLSFEEELLKKRSCRNNCKFCFVAQLPKGMRKTLYFKDEDWRYSFIMGNYVTMSAISEEELKRIIKRQVSPLYISVHTVDEELRKELIGNKNAVPIRYVLNSLNDAGIAFHAQVVMLNGENDGEKLKETIEYLLKMENCCSLAVVPVGLTKHRDNCPLLKQVDKECALNAIKIIEHYQKTALQERGERFVFASDEMYIRAGKELPAYEEYEDFAQIENGVGMIRLFEDDLEYALEEYKGKQAAKKKISIATGVDFYPFLKKYAKMINEKYNADIHVYDIKNDFFGRSITVTGLLTAGDIISQLKGKDLGTLMLTSTLLRDASNVFLDDMTVDDVQKALNVPVVIVNGAEEMVKVLFGRE